MHLTTHFADGSQTLRTEAIYTLDADTLTYCVAPPNQPIPIGFATAQGDGNTLVMLKRLPFLGPLWSPSLAADATASYQ